MLKDTTTGKEHDSVLVNINLLYLYNSVIPLIGICPRKNKVCVHTKTCLPRFTAVLFVIAKNRNKSHYHQQATGKQIGICPYNGKLFSSKKKQPTIDTQNNINDFQNFFSIFMLKKSPDQKKKYVQYNSTFI